MIHMSMNFNARLLHFSDFQSLMSILHVTFLESRDDLSSLLR